MMALNFPMRCNDVVAQYLRIDQVAIVIARAKVAGQDEKVSPPTGGTPSSKLPSARPKSVGIAPVLVWAHRSDESRA